MQAEEARAIDGCRLIHADAEEVCLADKLHTAGQDDAVDGINHLPGCFAVPVHVRDIGVPQAEQQILQAGLVAYC